MRPTRFFLVLSLRQQRWWLCVGFFFPWLPTSCSFCTVVKETSARAMSNETISDSIQYMFVEGRSRSAIVFQQLTRRFGPSSFEFDCHHNGYGDSEECETSPSDHVDNDSKKQSDQTNEQLVVTSCQINCRHKCLSALARCRTRGQTVGT